MHALRRWPTWAALLGLVAVCSTSVLPATAVYPAGNSMTAWPARWSAPSSTAGAHPEAGTSADGPEFGAVERLCCVIPAAGLGTRFLPATKAVPKELLPVLDRPVIQWAVEEAVAAGAGEIVLVLGEGKDEIAKHLQPDP